MALVGGRGADDLEGPAGLADHGLQAVDLGGVNRRSGADGEVKGLEPDKTTDPALRDPCGDFDPAAEGELEQTGADIGPLAGGDHALGDGAGGGCANDAPVVVALGEAEGGLGGREPGLGEIEAGLGLVEGRLGDGLVRSEVRLAFEVFFSEREIGLGGLDVGLRPGRDRWRRSRDRPR